MLNRGEDQVAHGITGPLALLALAKRHGVTVEETDDWVVEVQVLAYDSAQAAQDALDAVESYYAGSYDFVDVGPVTDHRTLDEPGDDALGYQDYTTILGTGSPRVLLEFIRQGPTSASSGWPSTKGWTVK